MILTLAWKEYREHRSVWFTMVLLTGLAGLAAAQLSSPGNLEATARLGLGVLALAGAYGVVCGAMMLAGEREGGTLVFLDIFLGRRGLLWSWKLVLGVVLAVTEALAVALVLHWLKQAPPDWLTAFLGQGTATGFGMPAGGRARAGPYLWFAVLPLVTLEAYAWGLLGSSLTRRVLPGAGVGILIAFPFWLMAIVAPPPVFLGIRLVAAVAALVFSLVIFQTQSRDTPLGPTPRAEEPRRRRRPVALERWEGERYERVRRAAQKEPVERPVADVLAPAPEPPPRDSYVRRAWPRPLEAHSPGQVLLWLSFGQARLLMPCLAGAAVLLGLAMPSSGQVLWPLATLFIGVACGTATFAQEQSDLSYQFLAAQHFPLTTVWKVKTLFWAAAAVLASLVLVIGASLTVLVTFLAARRPGGVGPDALPAGSVFGTLRQLLGPVLFFGVWLVYGFCAGQVFVLLCRKSVLAVVLAGLVALGALGLWLPSLLCLGMNGWQLWVPPILALVATRSLVRAWSGGRIKDRKPLAALVGFGAVALAWGGLIFALRAWEIPDVGEPLDRAAFRAAIPTGKDNQAGQKIHDALAAFEDPKGGGHDWLERLTEARRPREEKALPVLGASTAGLIGSAQGQGPLLAAFAVFPGRTEGKRRPLGVLDTPRGDGQTPLLRHLPICRKMTTLLRNLAWVAPGQKPAGAAVDYLANMLFLSRNLRNKAPVESYLVGVEVEQSALQGLDEWLAQGKPAPHDVKRALDELNVHVATTPPALDCLQTECFRAGGLLANPIAWGFRGGGEGATRVPEGWLADGIALSLHTPWEKERKTRLWRAVWDGLLRAARTPHWQLPEAGAEAVGEKETTREILRGWLPAPEGAGASLTSAQLARLLDESWLSDLRLFAPVVAVRDAATRPRCRVESCRLVIALALYQMEKGKAAARLEDLVPAYLPEMPVDPYSGQAFRYRLSKGEQLEIATRGPPQQLVVQPGQGLVWSVGPDGVDHGGQKHGGELADSDLRWARGGLDLVTVVPQWP